MVTLLFEDGHGLLVMLQLKTLLPTPKPVTPVVGDKELVIVPLPETRVQTPTPVVGVLAAIVTLGLLAQAV